MNPNRAEGKRRKQAQGAMAPPSGKASGSKAAAPDAEEGARVRKSASNPRLRTRTVESAQQLKRARGEISCAECRRLKLRCDKSIPCNSCVRRGCPVICPNGVLSSGQGSRFILANTDELHQKLDEMCNRIRILEDALAASHASNSDVHETHPLLEPKLLEIKHYVPKNHDSKRDLKDDKASPPVEEELDIKILDSFGNLAIEDRDSGGENSMSIEGSDPTSNKDDQQPLPDYIQHLGSTIPFTATLKLKHEVFEYIASLLPTFDRAKRLCENYLIQMGWWMQMVPREQLFEELLPKLYGVQMQSYRDDPSSSTESSENYGNLGEQGIIEGAYGINALDEHELAAFLIVLALGILGDLELAPANAEAEMFVRCAQAAINLKPVIENTSLVTVQAVCLLASYDNFAMRKSKLDTTWKIIDLGSSLAASIGLYRDPSPDKFDKKMIQRRRHVFWELRHMDLWKSMGSGRPAHIHQEYVDCKLPVEKIEVENEDGTVRSNYLYWKYSFNRDVMEVISKRLSSAKPLKYVEILEMDQQVREYGPQYLKRQIVETPIDVTAYKYRDNVRAYLDKYMLSLMKEFTLQLLHRNFFARAVFENPENPLKSSFAPSFLSTFNSAVVFMRIVREHVPNITNVFLRNWGAWMQIVESTIVAGIVAARAPSSEFALRGYKELVETVAEFSKMKTHAAVQARLPAIERLRTKAERALSEAGVIAEEIQKYSSLEMTKTHKDIVDHRDRAISESRGLEARIKSSSGNEPSGLSTQLSFRYTSNDNATTDTQGLTWLDEDVAKSQRCLSKLSEIQSSNSTLSRSYSDLDLPSGFQAANSHFDIYPLSSTNTYSSQPQELLPPPIQGQPSIFSGYNDPNSEFPTNLQFTSDNILAPATSLPVSFDYDPVDYGLPSFISFSRRQSLQAPPPIQSSAIATETVQRSMSVPSTIGTTHATFDTQHYTLSLEGADIYVGNQQLIVPPVFEANVTITPAVGSVEQVDPLDNTGGRLVGNEAIQPLFDPQILVMHGAQEVQSQQQRQSNSSTVGNQSLSHSQFQVYHQLHNDYSTPQAPYDAYPPP